MSYSHYIVLLASLLIVTACDSQQENHDHQHTTFILSDTMLKRTELAVVQIEPVKTSLKLTGKIVPDEDKMVEIFPLVGGNVMDVNVELGEYVEKGKVLAVIRSGEVADYERQMIDAQSDVIMAQKNLKIAEDLYESKLNSDKDVIGAQKELEKAHARQQQLAEIFRIYGLGKNSEYIVKAPISGFITEKSITRDMQLRSDKSDNIFTIAQISDVWVTANIYETDISKIKTGMKASIQTLSYPDKLFEGKVDRIFNILDPATKTMKARIKLKNDDFALKPEMNATVTVTYEESRKMLSVPSSAIIFDMNKNYVIIFKNKFNISIREVEIYRQHNGVTYIKNGLEEGETVVSKNQLFIYDALNE